MANNGQMIVDLDKKRMQAMAAKEIATLDALLADDLIYTHSTARLDTKQSLIANMKSGATVYSAVEPSEVRSQDLGDAVVLTGLRGSRFSRMERSLTSACGLPTPMLSEASAGRWLCGSRHACRTKFVTPAHGTPISPMQQFRQFSGLFETRISRWCHSYF